jgi:hypothetical protein
MKVVPVHFLAEQRRRLHSDSAGLSVSKCQPTTGTCQLKETHRSPISPSHERDGLECASQSMLRNGPGMIATFSGGESHYSRSAGNWHVSHLTSVGAPSGVWGVSDVSRALTGPLILISGCRDCNRAELMVVLCQRLTIATFDGTLKIDLSNGNN